VKVAFAIIPEKGHINPYIGPAQALVEAGHEVVIAAPGDIGDQIARAGLVFRPDLIDHSGDGRVTRGAELVSLIQDAERLHLWIEQLLLGGVCFSLPSSSGQAKACPTDQLQAWYRRERADVVVIDPLYYPAAIAAHLDRIPWASVSNSLNPVIPADLDSALLRTVRELSPRRAELFRACGFDAAFSGCDVLSPYLTVAFATEALVGKPPAGVTLVGPSLPLHARGDELAVRPLPVDRPIVYVSFGSQIYFWPEIFEKMIAAGRMLDAHLVLALGDLVDDPRWAASRPHCDVYRYAPQPEILRRAAVFVTHGGANSVMEAIQAGVPMLISPMCNDQFHQAYFVERAGIGRVENLVKAPVERIVDRLRELLTSPVVRSNMEAVSRTYQTNGARTTAQLIAKLVDHD
jgi:UDP:flavonoid glycosyltransferase YjiC (YdhE family)